MKFVQLQEELMIINEIKIDTLTEFLKDDIKRAKLLSAVKSNNSALLGPKEIVDQQGNKLNRNQVNDYFRQYGIYDITDAQTINAGINLVLNYYFS